MRSWRGPVRLCERRATAPHVPWSGPLSSPPRDALKDLLSAPPSCLLRSVPPPCAAGRPHAPASPTPHATRRTNLPVPGHDESRASAWPKADVSALRRVRAHKRARRSFEFVRWFCPSWAAADRHPRAVPSRGRWRWLAWSNARHACLRGRDASPHAQTRRLVSWVTSPRACPAAPAPSSPFLAWLSPLHASFGFPVPKSSFNQYLRIAVQVSCQSLHPFRISTSESRVQPAASFLLA